MRWLSEIREVTRDASARLRQKPYVTRTCTVSEDNGLQPGLAAFREGRYGDEGVFLAYEQLRGRDGSFPPKYRNVLMEAWMKIVGIITALALATSPMLAVAQQTDDDDERAAAVLEPGGVAQDGDLDVFALSAIPLGAVVVGGVVILGGIIVGVIAAGDSTVSTTN